jgi:hypothetical protein
MLICDELLPAVVLVDCFVSDAPCNVWKRFVDYYCCSTILTALDICLLDLNNFELEGGLILIRCSTFSRAAVHKILDVLCHQIFIFFAVDCPLELYLLVH